MHSAGVIASSYQQNTVVFYAEFLLGKFGTSASWGYDGYQTLTGGIDGRLNGPTSWKPEGMPNRNGNFIFKLEYVDGYILTQDPQSENHYVHLQIYAPNSSDQVDNSNWWTSFSGTSPIKGAFTFNRADATFTDNTNYLGGKISTWLWNITESEIPWGGGLTQTGIASWTGDDDTINDFLWT